MAHRRCISQIQSQFVNINQSFHTVDHHLIVGDNSRARLEMEDIMALITELYSRVSNLENIGRQPEEILTSNNTTNYNDNLLVILQ